MSEKPSEWQVEHNEEEMFISLLNPAGQTIFSEKYYPGATQSVPYYNRVCNTMNAAVKVKKYLREMKDYFGYDIREFRDEGEALLKELGAV